MSEILNDRNPAGDMRLLADLFPPKADGIDQFREFQTLIRTIDVHCRRQYLPDEVRGRLTREAWRLAGEAVMHYEPGFDRAAALLEAASQILSKIDRWLTDFDAGK